MVHKTCCVTGCNPASKKNALFFKVPTMRSLRRRWTDAIRPRTTITMDSYICDAHFLTTDYESVRGKTRLKRRVVPSIFDNGEIIKTSKLRDDPSMEQSANSESSPTAANGKDTQVTDTEVPDTEVPTTEVADTGISNTGFTKAVDTEVPNTVVTDITETEVSITGITDTEVTNTGVTDITETELSNKGITDTEVSNTGVRGITEAEVSNTGITDTEVSNTGITEITDTGISNTEFTNFIDIEVPNIGVTEVKDTEGPNTEVTDIGALNNMDKPTENVEDTIIRTKPVEASHDPRAEAPFDDVVLLNDKTGALTNSSGADIHVSPADTPRQRLLTAEKYIKRTPKALSPVPDMNKEDIEEILTNYHIKQTKPLQSYEQLAPEPEVVDLSDVVETQPVFIEISVDKDRRADTSAGDCLMLLESVQVDVDPSSLMLPERVIEEVEGVIGDDDDDDDDDDVVIEETTKKRDDPISLLTSSDEDDVIIEEPDIDTVEVSDETDEDDVPLVQLVKTARAGAEGRRGGKKSDLCKIFWGVCDYYCVECHFRTFSRAEYDKHMQQHSTVLQVCQLCGYTTASEAQFSRHKKKHKEERKFKCHLCDYKARHKMSLVYHLRTHNLKTSRKGHSKCVCGFKSSDTTKIAKHLKVCSKRYTCDKCSYATKRRSDLKRHRLRRHSEGDDEYTPSWE